MIQIHTDGSCLGNPGAGGWAAVIVDENNQRTELCGGDVHTTNNRMELTAALRALEKISAGKRVELYTDSSYLKNAFTNGWLSKWKRNGWRTSTGNAVLNRDLWLELDALISTRNVNFNWVKGHAGNPLNERCDELARTTAAKFQRGEKISMPPIKTSVPPSKTSVPPSKTSVPPSKTSAPPTKTSAPPTKTSAPPKNFERPVQLSLFD